MSEEEPPEESGGRGWLAAFVSFVWYVILVGSFIAAVGGVGYLGLVLYRVPPLLLILYTFAFVVGLAFIPLIGWTIGPSLGRIAEGLANVLWIISMITVGRGLLVQRETDEYVIERGNPDLRPRSYWTRWALASFGITFDPTEQAFGSAAIDDDLKLQLHEAFTDGGENVVGVGLDRGGVGWFALKEDVGGIHVLIGQKLAELRNAAGPELGLEAYAVALGKHGGDTSGSSNRMRLIGTFLFAVLGLGMGWVVFF